MTYALRCDDLGIQCNGTAEGESSDDAVAAYIGHLHDKHQVFQPSATLEAYLANHVRESAPDDVVEPVAFGSSDLSQTWPAALWQAAQARLRTRGNIHG